MNSFYIDQEIKYDGTQLKSLFAYMNHGVLGDSIVSFMGSCDVSFEHMVDGEDLRAQSAIRGSKMLHFIVEEFGVSLNLAVTRQRLLAAIVRERIQTLNSNAKIEREGDDLYYNEGKLSISIATVSPVSALIHFAINISNQGTPVKTSSLEDLKINPQKFANDVMENYVKEIKTIKEACCKVRWVN